MKAIYYLANSLGSTQSIADELNKAGVNDWFIHIISNDESSISQSRLHSSNYLETLDLVRDGFIGAALGLVIGIAASSLLAYIQPLGIEVPNIILYLVVGLITLFGLWEGGLAGIASKNRKLAEFDEDLSSGKYLILIYTTRKNEARIQYIMDHKFPGVRLAAKDSHFLNPFSKLKHI